jgi:hypothetical protein
VPDYAVGDTVEVVYAGIISAVAPSGWITLGNGEVLNANIAYAIRVSEKAKVEPKVGDMTTDFDTLPNGTVVRDGNRGVLFKAAGVWSDPYNARHRSHTLATPRQIIHLGA